MKVEVTSINPPARNRAQKVLAQAAVKLTLTGHLGNEYTFVFQDIAIVPDSMPGEYGFSFPRFKNADAPPEPAILASWLVRKAITDVLIPAFKKWQAEQADRPKQAEYKSQQKEGAR